jgi:selenoprotein W-related protein
MSSVVITYCKPCGYLKRAEAAAALLNERLGVSPELVPGTGGIFKVAVDGDVVAAKSRAGFPDAEQIADAVAAALV